MSLLLISRFRLNYQRLFNFVVFCYDSRVCDAYILAQVRADIRIRVPVIVVVVRETDA
jgi:hypothetical protein